MKPTVKSIFLDEILVRVEITGNYTEGFLDEQYV